MAALVLALYFAVRHESLDSAVGVVAFYFCYKSGGGDFFDVGNAKGPELFCYVLAGFVFLKGEFGVRMQVVPDAGDVRFVLAGEGLDGFF